MATQSQKQFLHSNAVFSRAKRLVKSGFSVIPIRADGSKAAAIIWKCFQGRGMTEQELLRHFRRKVGIGIVCGFISGGLEVLDFEDAATYEAWANEVQLRRPGLLERLPVVETPSGGRHVYLRSRHGGGNVKLAWSTDKDRGKSGLLIESKGEGGYVLAQGSPPSCHETGKRYFRVAGPSLKALSRISRA